MRVNVKIILMCSVEVPGKNLSEALAAAEALKERDIVQFKRGVDWNDGLIKVTGVETGEWTE